MTPWLDDGDVRLYHGDNLDVLRQLPSGSVHMCATSPPFYGLRDYGTSVWEYPDVDCPDCGNPEEPQLDCVTCQGLGSISGGGDPDCDHTDTFPSSEPDEGKRRSYGYASDRGGNRHNRGEAGPVQHGGWEGRASRSDGYAECGKCGARRVDKQIGLEETPDQWVERLVAVFREVRRVLRDDGTLWIELGDSYSGTTNQTAGFGPTSGLAGADSPRYQATMNAGAGTSRAKRGPGLKNKDLIGQPWLVAFALRADGWYLRSEIIWARPNPMPESVTDRPTKSHSTVFLLSKQPRYFMDMEAIREEEKPWNNGAMSAPKFDSYTSLDKRKEQRTVQYETIKGANARSVWTIPTQPTPFAHFATWPEALVRRMILAGCPERACRTCGKPSERITGRDEPVPGESRSTWGDAKRKPGLIKETLTGHAAQAWLDAHPVKTLGWSDCKHNNWGPGIVLDPFAGSATTMLVARNHGRHSIGIELNADYLRIAAKRLQQLSLLST